jgi:hypothetical protein
MTDDFTKPEMVELFREFHYILGGKYTKDQWERFLHVKRGERFSADLEQLEAEGLVDVFEDEHGEMCAMPTEKGLQSAKRQELERIGS